MTVAADELHAKAEDKMKKAIQSLQHELATIRTARANAMILDRISLDYYGTPTPVRQMANISVQEGQTLLIQPYDKSQLGEIERAISKSDLSLPVNNDGSVLRINVPPLSEERRKEMVKMAKKMSEEAKVAIRNIRRDASTDLDKVEKSENMPEDDVKHRHDLIQKLTDKFTGQVDSLVTEKEKELLEV